MAGKKKNLHPGLIVGNVINSIGVAIGDGATSNITLNKFDGPPPLSSEETERLLAYYRARVLEDTRYVNLRGMPLPRGRDGRPMPLQVLLDKVYIRIQATTEKQRRVQEEAEERSLLNRLQGDSKSQTAPRDILSTLYILGEYFYRRGEVYEVEQRPEPVDPEEALKKHKRLVVLGAPGAGKSTLLRYLARRAAEGSDNFVPIQVSLRDYAAAMVVDSTLAISEFALRTASAGNTSLHQALEDEFENGRVFWLVDALDEARGWAANAARQIGQLPGQLILTSRPVGYVDAGLESLPHFEVLPLMPENIDEFLYSWFGLLAAQRSTNDEWIAARVAWLQKQLEERPRIRELTRNPLLLTFLVVLADDESLQELPEQRAEIYRRYVEDLLDSWEAERRPKSGAEGKPVFTLGSLQGEQARQMALQGFYYLGWALHQAYYGGKIEAPPTHDTLIKSLADYLQGAGEKDAKILSRAVLEFWLEAGLLETWYLDGVDYLAFRHLTFQEYAVAWGLAEAWQRSPKRTWDFLGPRLDYYPWHEPILLLAGLMPQSQLDNLARLLLHSTRAYEKYIPMSALMLDNNYLPEYLDYARSNIKIFRKHDALLNLFAQIGASALSVLLQAMRDRNEKVRSNAAQALGQIGDPRAIPVLLQAVRDVNTNVRWCATYALGQIGSPPVISILISLLSDPSIWVRAQAADSLGEIGDKQAVPALLQALQNKHRAMRWSAAKALRQIGDAQVLPALFQTLRDNDIGARIAKAYNHRQIGDPKGILAFYETLWDSVWDSRWYAAEALGQIGDVQAIPALLGALQDRNKKLRWYVAEALGWIRDVQAVPYLIQALEDRDKNVRSYAAEALGRINDVQAVPYLIQALQDRDKNVRSYAAEALGRINDVQAVPYLIQALEDRDKNVRSYAAEALGRIGDAQAVPHLIQALQDRHKNVRSYAAEVLGRIGDVQAVPHLIQALQDRDKKLRWYAAEALGQIGDVQAVPHLIQALQDRDKKLRARATTALKQIGYILTIWDLPLNDPLLPPEKTIWPLSLLKTSKQLLRTFRRDQIIVWLLLILSISFLGWMSKVEDYQRRGQIAAQSGSAEQAMGYLEKAIALNPISPTALNSYCWFGSLLGHADEVLHTCELVVKLAPYDGGIRDSRGLARALTENYTGAIEDFKFYVEWTKTHKQYEKYRAQREAWIVELEAGRNPFDEATLQALLKEQ